MKAMDAIGLEILSNALKSVNDECFVALMKASHSTNIKERHDHSTAIMDRSGRLIAQAEMSLPIHVASMGGLMTSLLAKYGADIQPGDLFVANDPHVAGGTHLPDVTVTTPAFDDSGRELLFFVGSRGHQADIGGTTPGSMPPDSHTLDEEGALLDHVKLVANGRLLEDDIRPRLLAAKYPARNPDQNIADLKAQIAANEKGVQELRRMVGHFGLDVVKAYMGHVRDNAEESVRRVIDVLRDGEFEYPMDEGSVVKVKITIDHATRGATLDTTGTSPQRPIKLHEPTAVVRAVQLSVFST